jgi:hypothetical protein
VVISADGYDLDVILQSGEWFGGRSFVEWREVGSMPFPVEVDFRKHAWCGVMEVHTG